MITDYYYFNKLSDDKKNIYKKLYQSITGMEESCLLSDTILEGEDALSIIDALDNDNPHLFYVNMRHLQVANNGKDTKILIKYYYSASEVKRYSEEIEAAVNNYLKHVNSSMEEYEKVRILYEQLVSNTEYAFDATENDVEAYSVLGVLKNKKGMCEGIAKAFKLLLNAADTKCIVVNGEAESPISADNNRHAWNIVKLGDTSFHVDPTWGIGLDTKDGGICYDYFGLTDSQISKDHWGYKNTPECRSDVFDYYIINNGSLGNPDELEPKLNELLAVPCRISIRLDYESDFMKETKRCTELAKELVKNEDYKVRINTGCREKQRIVVITTSRE